MSQNTADKTNAAEARTKETKGFMQQVRIAARAFHRILKLGRTIADLASAELIEPSHIAEALQYRPRNLI